MFLFSVVYEALNPFTARLSSVKVPVLSKTIIVTRPARFTLGGDMQ